MPTLLRATSSRLEPIDIPYRHGQELRNGAHFMVLPTLEALESHWARIRHLMPFAARGNCPGSHPLYLRPNEWIFALTAYFSDRGRSFQSDHGRRFSVMADGVSI
jgi:hypothetical protein